ncbi:MAG: glycoside hydrolase family 5 protein [Clostridiales bacterium]|jgi:aryl-phospho-beta-D-glucosidase BglC (GH1 family)|nr:glycoside hydrolase family 5 protein [Clostridiales bacterium]
MKKAKIIAVTILGVCISVILASCNTLYTTLKKPEVNAPSGALPEAGFLKTYKSYIIDSDGEAVFLRGVNAGGYLIQEAWMCPTETADQITLEKTLTERFGEAGAAELLSVYRAAWWADEDFDNVKALGFNVIRLPFGYFNITKPPYTDYDFSLIDAFIDGAAARGLYVILDLHGAFGSQNGKDHSGDTSQNNLFGNAENERLTIELWRKIAERYRDEPFVAGYDLLNEPEGTSGKTDETQWDFYDRAIRAVRAADERHIIFVESVWEARGLPTPSKYGWQNVVYEYHNYQWVNLNSFSSQKRFVISKVLSYKGANFDVPIFIGEFTCFENLDSWRYTLNAYNKNRYSWTLWTYKVINKGSTWGMYTGNPPVVYPETDSFDVIKAKWQSAATVVSFEKNARVTDAITPYVSQ